MALPTTPIRVTVLGTTTTTPTPTTTEMCTSTTRQAAGSSTPAAAGRSHRLASIALTRITGPRHAIRARAAGATFTPGRRCWRRFPAAGSCGSQKHKAKQTCAARLVLAVFNLSENWDMNLPSGRGGCADGSRVYCYHGSHADTRGD